MNLNILSSLGKIAGVAGIALGAVVLLGDKLISTVAGLPTADRAPIVQLLTIGTFGIGFAGLLVWLITSYSRGTWARTSGKNSPAIVAGGNVSINAPPAPTPPIAARGVKSATPIMPQGSASAKGDDSPAVIAGGNVTVNTPPSPPLQ